MDYEGEDPEQVLDREEFTEKSEEDTDNQEWFQSQTLTPKKSDSLFGLFKDVWKTGDSSKVGCLDKQELGNLTISVRGCQHLAMLGKTFNHEKFGKFFQGQGELILATSASKKGWFTELFVSQKKYSNRTLGSNNPNQSNQPKSSWSIKNLMGGSSDQPSNPPAQ